MPHITQLNKKIYIEDLYNLKIPDPVKSKGDLTWIVYWIAANSCLLKPSYTSISCAISCLEDAADELRRLHLHKYEDKKIKLNGDALDCSMLDR